MFKCRVFGGKTGPFPVGRVFRVVRPVATVRFRVEPDPEPTREFGPVANTICIATQEGVIIYVGRVSVGRRHKSLTQSRIAKLVW
jgi:hypothetical protein